MSMSGDKPPDKTVLNLETPGRRGCAASQRLIFQTLSRSQGVLASSLVCKLFAHECWLVCTERWLGSSLIRTERWLTQALVCKPERFCSQATTHSPGGSRWRGGKKALKIPIRMNK